MTDKAQPSSPRRARTSPRLRADLAAGRLNSASSGAYYAMFHAARAALESRGIETGGRKHGTVTQAFGLGFVKSGPLAPDHGRNLRRAQKLRNEGDYDIHTPDAADVEEVVGNAVAFVDAVAALLAPT